MTQYMSTASLAAQEAARQNNGRFGSQLHGEMAGGTDVLGTPVNLAKESGAEARFEGDVLAPGDIPHVMVSGEPKVYDRTEGRVFLPQIHDLERVHRESGSDELSITVKFDPKDGASMEREVKVSRTAAGRYQLEVPTDTPYTDDEKVFMTEAASSIAAANADTFEDPAAWRRHVKHANTRARTAMMIADIGNTPWGVAEPQGDALAPAPTQAVPGTLDRAELAEHQKAHMKTWNETEDSRGRMQRAREAAEDSYKPPGFFASLGRALRR